MPQAVVVHVDTGQWTSDEFFGSKGIQMILFQMNDV